jgi:hypothetical protein
VSSRKQRLISAAVVFAEAIANEFDERDRTNASSKTKARSARRPRAKALVKVHRPRSGDVDEVTRAAVCEHLRKAGVI